jgi:hypothetical protein
MALPVAGPRPYPVGVSTPWGQQDPGSGGQPPPSYPSWGYPPGYPGYGAGHPGAGPGYAPYGYRPAGPPPPSRLGWAIAALLLFWPLAIPAFIYSNRVESAWYQGDVAGARRASDNAKTCGVIAVVVGVVMALLMIVLFAAVLGAGGVGCVDQFGNSC